MFYTSISQLNSKKLNKNVILWVWISEIKKLGNFLWFLIGQDSTGQIQIVIKNTELIKKLDQEGKKGNLLKIWGVAKKKTGSEKDLEIEMTRYQLINSSRALPFEIKDNINEDTRYRYRYLDLRRPESRNLLLVKNRFLYEIRKFLHERKFVDIETPLLAQSSPEGAKCFVVPSNLPNRYYTLPQSAQIFKQLLMVSGFAKYYQIAKSFRNEDARSNRQIEFSQLELEMSFTSEQQIRRLVEKLLKSVLKKVFGYQLITPFPALTYQQAIKKYGTDKPDLRNNLEIQDFFDYYFFSNQKKSELIKGLCIPFFLSDKEVKELKEQLIKEEGKNLNGFIISGSEKNLTQNYLTPDQGKHRNIIINHELIKEFWLQKINDKSATLFVLKGEKEKILSLLGKVRMNFNQHFTDKKNYEFLWITDWPLFEYNKETKKYEAFRHPFTTPQKKYIQPLLNGKISPEEITSEAFDLVCNGEEILSGSMRIYTRELQEKVLEVLGYSLAEQKKHFSYFLEALGFAAPPHGGAGLGIDRLLAVVCQVKNLKELIAFPKNIDGTCSLTRAPNHLKK